MNLAAWKRRFWQNAIDPQHPFASMARWPRWLLEQGRFVPQNDPCEGNVFAAIEDLSAR